MLLGRPYSGANVCSYLAPWKPLGDDTVLDFRDAARTITRTLLEALPALLSWHAVESTAQLGDKDHSAGPKNKHFKPNTS